MHDQNSLDIVEEEQYASLILSYLEDFGISIPWLTPEMVKPMIEQALRITLYYVIPYDYMTEIQATINYVAGQLNEHGI